MNTAKWDSPGKIRDGFSPSVGIRLIVASVLLVIMHTHLSYFPVADLEDASRPPSYFGDGLTLSLTIMSANAKL